MSTEEVYPIFDFSSNYNLIKITHPTANIEEISLMRVIGSSQHIRSRVVVGYRIINTTFIAIPCFYRSRFKPNKYPELIHEEPNDPKLLSYLNYTLMEKNGIDLKDCLIKQYAWNRPYYEAEIPSFESDFNKLKQVCDYIDAFKTYVHSVRSTETITVEETLKRVNKNIVQTGTILLVILLMVVVYICFLIRDRL